MQYDSPNQKSRTFHLVLTYIRSECHLSWKKSSCGSQFDMIAQDAHTRERTQDKDQSIRCQSYYADKWSNKTFVTKNEI